MKVYKLRENAKLPEYATAGSACFDIRACYDGVDRVKTYNPANREGEFPIRVDGHGRRYYQLFPYHRALIPTGLIFGINKGQVLKLYSRSGTSAKRGLVLANGVGVIDSDYVEETFIIVTNTSDVSALIYDGDRIAQGEVQEAIQEELKETKRKPIASSKRKGGIGSTGEK